MKKNHPSFPVFPGNPWPSHDFDTIMMRSVSPSQDGEGYGIHIRVQKRFEFLFWLLKYEKYDGF
jgi:hypothetical protein